MAKFIFLVREDLTRYPMPEEKLNTLIKLHSDWAKSLSERGYFLNGNGLSDEGKIIEKKEGQIVQSPLRDLKEGIGGFYVIEAKDMNQALSLAKEFPTFDENEKVEVRALF